MSKKTPDTLEPVDGPFQIPESKFPPSDLPGSPTFTDADVEAAMNEVSYVTEGPPDLNPAPAPPPLPTPPVGTNAWSTVNPRDRRIDPPSNTAVPPDDDDDAPPDYINPSQAPAASAPTPSSGLVVEFSPEPVETADDEEDDTDLGSTTMMYAAIGIIAALLGMGGAAIIAVVLLQVQQPTPQEPQVSVVPAEEASKVPVRRDMNAPPKPDKIYIEPTEDELNEVPTGDPEGAEGEPAPVSPKPAPKEPATPTKPIGSVLD